MEKSIIDVIFNDYADTREFAELSVSPEIDIAERAVLKVMGRTNEHEELVTALIARVERRLFTLGFQYGVRFMCECMGRDAK